MVESTFGNTVRGLRVAQGIGLRKFAKQVGISPTYLSKIERNEFPPPAEDKVVAIAAALDQDRDTLLGLAGRIGSDLEQIILTAPQAFGALIRSLDGVAPGQVAALAEEVASNGPPDQTMEAAHGAAQ